MLAGMKLVVHPCEDWSGIVHGHIDYRATAICGSRAYLVEAPERAISCPRCIDAMARRGLQFEATASPPARAG